VAGSPYTLDVAIRTLREGLLRGELSQPPIPQLGDTTIWVVISDETDRGHDSEGGAFTINHRYQSLEIPHAGDSIGSATFRITPRADVFGTFLRGRIGVRIYHKLNLIDHVELNLAVVARGMPTRAADGSKLIEPRFRRPQPEKSIEPLDPDRAGRQLTISVDKTPADTYCFAFALDIDNSGKPQLTGSRVLSETVLNDFVAKFREILLDTVFGPSLLKVKLAVEERDELLQKLSALGTTIVGTLFNVQAGRGDLFELGEMLYQAMPELAMIQVSLSEGARDFVFPWQILTIEPYTDSSKPAKPDNLWGYRFVIEVKRCGDGARTENAPSPIRVSYGRWRNFPNEPSHYDDLKKIISSAAVPSRLIDPVIDNAGDFINALLAGHDFIYVYAHGHAAPPLTPGGLAIRDRIRTQVLAIKKRIDANQALALDTSRHDLWIEVYNRHLDATTTGTGSEMTFSDSAISLASLTNHRVGRKLISLESSAPVVFLNTCQSAQVWNAVEDSFVGFFLDRGARAVLGTETTIPIVIADVFGRAVLRTMFCDGDSLGEAVFKARRSLLEDNGNPLGLCYSIYGAADARVVPPSKKVATVDMTPGGGRS